MYQKEKKSWLKHLDFTLLDMIMQEFALLLAYAFRFERHMFLGGPLLNMFIRVGFVLILVDVLVIFLTDSYSGILRRTKYDELRAVVIHGTAIFAGIMIYLYATQMSYLYSRQALFTYYILAMLFEYVTRVVYKRVIRRRKLNDVKKQAMIAVVESHNAEECIESITADKYTDSKVTGIVIVDENRVGEEICGIPVVATADTFMEYLRTNVVDEVFINGNTLASAEALAAELVEYGITVRVALIHADKLLHTRQLENYGSYVTLTASMNMADSRQLFFKRVLDIIGGLVGLIITGVIFIFYAPILKIQSPGPVFYTSTRIGRNGRRFHFYKFRTMYPDADQRLEELMKNNEMQGLMFKMENDPRIIPAGHFIRKFSLDEFPQFLNVLRGDMSLVGTRPPTEREFEQYEMHHKARLAFRPGLTGMWQASGRNDITDFEEIVKLDTWYIANWNLWLDIKIIFLTIGAVITARGSK